NEHDKLAGASQNVDGGQQNDVGGQLGISKRLRRVTKKLLEDGQKVVGGWSEQTRTSTENGWKAIKILSEFDQKFAEG
ncbi:unnamed protein product, partial [Ilex paraguariensis]